MALPRHHTPRSDLPTRGGQVAAIAAAKGKPLLPWQREAIDVALEFDPATGLYRYGTIVITVPRQCGKTTLIGTMADHRCISRPGARVWITMQKGKTADSWMRNDHMPTLEALGDPEKKSCPYKKSLRAGEVGIVWKRLNSTFFTFPPKRDALHSKQSDLAVISEAWAHNMEVGADIRQAIRPTMATRRNAQLVVESTMGDDSSVFLDGYIDLGVASLSNPGSRVCFIDYGIADDDDPEDMQLLASKHPGYTGGLVGMQALLDAREEFDADPTLGGLAGWARAYGNRPTRTREAAIPAIAWRDAARPRPDVPERAGIALDATPSGDRFALSAGWRDSEDHGFVEVLASGPPQRETVDIIAQVLKRAGSPLIVDRAAIGALEIVDALVKKYPWVTVQWLTMAEYASGCGIFYRGILDDTVHHFNQPELTAAVEVATKRDLGDGGFGWGRKPSSGPIPELVSASSALKAWDLLPRTRRITRVISAQVA